MVLEDEDSRASWENRPRMVLSESFVEGPHREHHSAHSEDSAQDYGGPKLLE